MAQPLAVPFHQPPSMLPAAYMAHSLPVLPEADIRMDEVDPLKGSLRIDECDDEDDTDIKPRPAKRSRMSFQCDDCGTSYTEKRALARHRHTDQHRKKLGLPPNKKHSCNVCGKMFGRGHDLKRHYNEQHPNAADRTTPVSTNSGEPSSSGSDYGSERAFSADGNFRSTSSPLAAPATHGLSMHDSPLLPDEKPLAPRYYMNGLEQPHVGHIGSVRRVRTMSDLHNSPTLPVIRMDQVDEMEIDDGSPPVIADHPHLRPSASVGSLAQRSETSSSRLSQYSTDNSIKTATTESVPDLHPYMAKPAVAKEELLDLNTPPKPNDDSCPPMACTMCTDRFEDEPDELLAHLRRHLEELKGEYRCEECSIGFVHREDLVRHQKSAAEGNCGFSFPHINPCTGHHPPSSTPSETPWVDRIPDSDSFRLCTKLRHWEQAQLHAYVSDINNLVASRKGRKFERWSVGAIMRGSRTSVRSNAISVNTYASAPCDMDDDEKHDIGGLQQRLRQMSLKKAGSSLKSIVKKQRLPSAIPEYTPWTMSRGLKDAISKGNLARAERLLREDYNHSDVQSADGTLTTEALWGQQYIAPFNAEHRMQADLSGNCSTCQIDNTALETGLGKVRMLLAHGADPAVKGGLCGFPLNTAAWMGKSDVVRLLLATKQVDIESLGSEYGTPLCTAAAQADFPGSLKVVKVLLGARADVHYQGPEGTALSLARKRRDALSLGEMGMRTGRDESAMRFGLCEAVIELLEEAERCRSPPMISSLYCKDSGVVQYKSYRSPSLAVG